MIENVSEINTVHKSTNRLRQNLENQLMMVSAVVFSQRESEGSKCVCGDVSVVVSLQQM